MSDRPPDATAVAPAPDRPRGGIDFAQYSTEQLIELRATFVAARFPEDHAALEQELARRDPSAVADAPGSAPVRFDVRLTARDGLFGWLAAKASRQPLFGSGTAELQADVLQLSGWSRTWLGVRQPAQVAYDLADIRNVAADGDLVRFDTPSQRRRRTVFLRLTDAQHASALAAQLPAVRDAGFDDAWSELTAFNHAVLAATPHTHGTTALVVGNVAVFIGLLALSASPWQVYAGQLQAWSVNLGTLTLNGDWWRLATALFLHANVPHIALNMWALWNVGRLCERLYGRATFLALYMLCGVSASMFSVLWDASRISVGASGAIFGLLGALLAFLTFGRPGVPAQIARAHRWSTLLFVVANLIAGALNYTVDNAAHVGGLLAGLGLGALLAAGERGESIGTARPARLGAAIAVTALLLFAGDLTARGGTTGTPEAYRWLHAHRWYVEGEAVNLKAWADVDQAITTGAVSREAAADRFARDVLPFWVTASSRLDAEQRAGAPSQLTVALAGFVSARLAWARAWLTVLKAADESREREIDPLVRRTLLAQARFLYRSTRQGLDDRPRSWSDTPLMARLRALVAYKTPDCVRDRNALSHSSGSTGSPTDGPARRYAAGCAAQVEFRTSSYAALDAQLRHDAAHLADLDDGSSSFAGEVAGLSDYFQYSGIDSGRILVGLSNWRRAVPGSVYPDLFEALLYETAAWQIRGQGYADSVSNQQWQVFSQRIEMAAAALEDAKPRGTATPLWYRLDLDNGLDRSVGMDRLRVTFEAGVGRFPGYERLYRDMLRALMPRWGGSYEAVDEFIRTTAARERLWTADMRYSYLYLQYAELEGDDADIFSDVGANWPRLTRGLEELRERFRWSDVILNSYLNLACRAGDADIYRSLRPKVKGRVTATVWTTKYSIEACDAQAAAGTLTPPVSRTWPGSASLAGSPPEASAATRPLESVFWGVRLGETRGELRRRKGEPLKVEGLSWLYNSRGPGDNGLIEVKFSRAGTAPGDRVVSIFYQGDYASCPPELTFIMGVTAQGLAEQFQPPVWSTVPNNDEELEMFGDGLTARLRHRRTVAYGIQSYYREAARRSQRSESAPAAPLRN